MKKKVVIGIILLVLLIGGIVGGSLYYYKSKDNNQEKTSNNDALKFKEEYEKLNNTVRASDKMTYKEIEISSNNPIKYIDTVEALDVLKEDKAIIYIGAAWCPYCRNAVNVLFDVAKKFDVKTIYYLNLDDEKDIFEIQDGKLVKTKNGTDGYYKLLDALKDHLKDYILYDDENAAYKTGEKRIYMPYVLGIKDGEIVSEYTWEIKFDVGQTKYDKLTDKQNEKLYNSYYALFNSVYGVDYEGNCNLNGCD